LISRFFKLGVEPSNNGLLVSKGKRLAGVTYPNPPTWTVVVSYKQPYNPTTVIKEPRGGSSQGADGRPSKAVVSMGPSSGPYTAVASRDSSSSLSSVSSPARMN